MSRLRPRYPKASNPYASSFGFSRGSFLRGQRSIPCGQLAKEIGPASYVDLNCDLYVSTSQALDFIFRHRIARVGTLISYDDWFETPLHQGESLAHEEAAKRFLVEFEYLPHRVCEAAAFPTLTFFRVRQIGVRAESGVTANLTALLPHYKRFDRGGSG